MPHNHDDEATERLERLARSFSALRTTPSAMFHPWDALRFAEFYRTGSSGEKDAALFVLSVWNPSTNWKRLAKLSRDPGPMGGFFDVHRALGNWDDANRAAFLGWARNPWWP